MAHGISFVLQAFPVFTAWANGGNLKRYGMLDATQPSTTPHPPSQRRVLLAAPAMHTTAHLRHCIAAIGCLSRGPLSSRISHPAQVYPLLQWHAGHLAVGNVAQVLVDLVVDFFRQKVYGAVAHQEQRPARMGRAEP